MKRFSWYAFLTALLIAALAGCTSQPTESPKTGDAGKTGSGAELKVPQSIGQAQATPGAQGAASPGPAAAVTTAAAPGERGEPRGRVVYAWHTALSPAWLDPQENPALITPYGFQYALHDALVKHLPGQPFAPSLAESYEIAPDFRSATFKLREGAKFPNGDPVTPEALQ